MPSFVAGHLTLFKPTFHLQRFRKRICDLICQIFFLAIPHKDSETRPKHCGWIISNNNPCVLVFKPLTKMGLWWHIYNDTIIMIIIIINNNKYNNIKSVYIVFTCKTKNEVKICIFEILRVLEHGPLPASQIRPIRPTHWLFDYAAAGTWWNRGADGIASLVYPKKYLSPKFKFNNSSIIVQ